MPTSDEIREYRATRGRFINALWDLEAAGANEYGAGIAVDDVLAKANIIGIQVHERARLVNDLAGDFMIQGRVQVDEDDCPRYVTLTSSGRLEVERWIVDDVPTAHLEMAPSQVFNFNGSVTGSSFVVGSDRTTVSMQTAVNEPLSALATKARELFDAWPGTGDDRDDAQIVVEDLEAEVANPSGNSGRVRALLRRVLTWAGHTALTAATTELAGDVEHLTHEALRQIT